MNVLKGDSKFYSDIIANMLGQTDLNKNFGVSIDHHDNIVEVRFNHTNKLGWANPTNWNILNEGVVKNTMLLRSEVKGIRVESEL